MLRRVLVASALGAILTYGALLRLDALFGKYGPFTHPRWVVALQHGVETMRGAVVPDGWRWERPTRRYYGDPQNYIRFAREMRHFYQAHVREPVFLAGTRFYLALTGGQNEAVSFASASFSLLGVLAIFLLGRALHSTAVGLAAALALAVEREVIHWAPDGWRDDAYTAAVAFAAWTMVRLARRPTIGWGLAVGMTAAAACLTRVTALLFIVPVLTAFVLLGDRPALRTRARAAAAAAVAFAVLAGPYFISMTIGTGDPLFAVNYHTIYYLDHEGQDPNQGLSAAEYVRRKFQAAPVATAETAFRGLTDVPFDNKWNGFDPWVPGLGATLRALAIAGLLGWLFVPAGRLLLIMLIGTLAPYMVTWSVGDGAAWRFTMPAYPLYLTAACWAAAEAVRFAMRRRFREVPWRRAVPRLAVAAGLIASYLLLTRALPYYVARESLLRGESTTIGAGDRDGAFFVEGWTDLTRAGSVTARLADDRAALVVPLPERRPYHVVFRIDPLPFPTDRPQRIHVAIEGRPVADLHLAPSTDRVGTYAFDVPADLVEPGPQRFELVADFERPMAEAGDAFPEVPRDELAAYRFWLARVTPR